MILICSRKIILNTGERSNQLWIATPEDNYLYLNKDGFFRGWYNITDRENNIYFNSYREAMGILLKYHKAYKLNNTIYDNNRWGYLFKVTSELKCI